MANSKITINFDYAVKEESINKYQSEVKIINEKINMLIDTDNEYYGFFNIYKNITKTDYEKILQFSKNLLYEEKIEYFIVLANKSYCLQIKSLFDLYHGSNPFENKIKFIFVDESIDGSEFAQIVEKIKNKSFAINVISKTGESFQTLLLFREFKYILEKNVGKLNANKYIYITTNNNFGSLFKLVQKYKYNHFTLFDNTTENFSNYTAAILFPLACAEINIDKYLEGAYEANQRFSNNSLEQNPAYQYAVIRHILRKNNFKIEVINNYSKDLDLITKVLGVYLNETSLKDSSGILALNQNALVDLKINSQIMNENTLNTFCTNIIIENPKYDYHIFNSANYIDDDLNALSSITFNGINKIIRNTIIENNVIIYKVPNVKIYISEINANTLGWIVSFMHRVSIMSAGLEAVNPFINNSIKNFNINLIKKVSKIIKGEK
ncbi:glucose-6-phosphate isomerase [Metamycoplasma hyosynoviae]|uniref:Glucose-6-phosphate isomerase n=1 Tax=Metamycoplasma hyosynoviae TaxID=29559 RepID=A0A4P1QFQ4_9BACT|nr:glucose-6-phosphate isomerase [Metamycoplasma hyosynoviae]ASI53673.1 hypothetical protein MHSN_00350 [Metamycoplasma hyosynoviae]MDC8918476.1 hypothetical protein [Metamycoplasma hyosynoviae]MDC8937141.1 hypothetical protein [Metamycoplasma hyosynoviae]MDC8962364.1 hypothetical protein [Metamycoplasma hyosynoviae]MDC8963012.1 hypothetical protein [Metamycoplasma hyosynoviae]